MQGPSIGFSISSLSSPWPLVIALEMIVFREFLHGRAKVALAQRNVLRQTL